MGLENTIYSVSENVGVVEVCAIVYSPTIDCPIEVPFDVSLSTSDNTAGIMLVFMQLYLVHMYKDGRCSLAYLQSHPQTILDFQGS